MIDETSVSPNARLQRLLKTASWETIVHHAIALEMSIDVLGTKEQWKRLEEEISS